MSIEDAEDGDRVVAIREGQSNGFAYCVGDKGTVTIDFFGFPMVATDDGRNLGHVSVANWRVTE